ncbi:hypothetical protein [Sphingomonas sp. S2-65]|uniref:hypothetical protein n=1 Tax=Sphingomonas sp. S2-65 TaxID=2903960 RepID=UPI001F40F98A|nr:hypothetical protein [Sphingomonas sp. S2-65]UYY59047.1 hypothetical protein LZ586_02800 [Sphingomonas sp. S2-65]
MLLYLLSALLQNAPERQLLPSPPAPPAPPAPPIYPRFERAPLRIERYVVDVEIVAGSEQLWQGTLRVATGQGASLRREVSQASALECGERTYPRGDQSLISLTLTPQRSDDTSGLADLRVRWGRPAPDACASSGSSARAVELNQSVRIEAGKWVTVTGDAGLVVRLRRRGS